MAEIEIPDGLKRLIGAALPTIIYKVEEGAIQRYADAVGDSSPMHTDVQYASKSKYGRLKAPSAFVGWPIHKAEYTNFVLANMLVKAGAPMSLLNGGVEYEFCEPVLAGDTLVATTKIASITGRETKMGKTYFTVSETSFINERGAIALIMRSTVLNY